MKISRSVILKETDVNRAQAEIARIIAEINLKASQEWGDSIHKNLQYYIDKVVEQFEDKGFSRSMIILNDFPANNRLKLEADLKKIATKIQTRVIVSFTDGGTLDTIFAKNKKIDA